MISSPRYCTEIVALVASVARDGAHRSDMALGTLALEVLASGWSVVGQHKPSLLPPKQARLIPKKTSLTTYRGKCTFQVDMWGD